jgi:hypothetical protein
MAPEERSSRQHLRVKQTMEMLKERKRRKRNEINSSE